MKEIYTKQEVIAIIEKLEIYHQSWIEHWSDDNYETVFEQNAFNKCLEMMKDMFWFIK